MKNVVLKASPRSVTGKQVRRLRREGLLPAVLYGHKFEPMAISLNAHDTALALSGLSQSALVTIELDGKEYPALVRERQKNYIRNEFIHIDFQVVSRTEKLRTNVSIDLHGVSPAVKDFNGVVVSGVTQVEVECLPQDLPERIVLDITKLVNIGDGIYVRDLVLPEGVTIHQPPEEMIVMISAPEQEVEVEVEEVELATEPEVIEKGKKEEEPSD
jgi:large subunit ribosomal protein L25